MCEGTVAYGKHVPTLEHCYQKNSSWIAGDSEDGNSWLMNYQKGKDRVSLRQLTRDATWQPGKKV